MASAIYTYEEKPIVVLTASYNNQKWVEHNLRSIFKQDYSNYRVIYIDDASQDKTADIVERWLKEQSKQIRFDLIRNKERVGVLSNIYKAVHTLCKEEEIVVILDGDDWFYGTVALKRINHAYSTQEVWLTHGTFKEFPSKTGIWSRPIPADIVASNTFRTFLCPTHLKTFYAWLFKKIRLEDLQYEGKFFVMTGDQAIMFPMIEMAGERHAFIKKPIYVYNTSNPINDSKVNRQLQRDLETLIRSKPPYQRLSHK